MQLDQCHCTIKSMQWEMAQKNAIITDLAAQVTQNSAAEGIVNGLVEEDPEEHHRREQAQCTLEELTTQRDSLEARASGHKKVVTMLHAQIAALKLKADKSDGLAKQVTAALKVEQSRTKVCEDHCSPPPFRHVKRMQLVLEDSTHIAAMLHSYIVLLCCCDRTCHTWTTRSPT